METLVFGDPFLAPRTIRACGGAWVDLETHDFAARDTLLVQAGALLRPIPAWTTSTSLIGSGATLEEDSWKKYLEQPAKSSLPRARTYFISAAAIRALNVRRRTHHFWEALEGVRARRWVEPQLRNWFCPRQRVLQLITSLHVGGAERVCVELARMIECVGVATWFASKRTPLRKADWDLSAIPDEEKLGRFLRIAHSLHIDIVHSHLLRADLNSAIEQHFPVVTTIHNTPEGWPRGYDRSRPGLLVACSRRVRSCLGGDAQLAWNGVSMPVTRKPRVGKRVIRLIAVANFRAQKRLHRIPAILTVLKRAGFSPFLTVIGQVNVSEQESRLAHAKFWQAVSKHKMKRRVQVVSTVDVRPQLARSTVFISTSANEGMSLAQLEALGAGLPVVATNVGGAEEITELASAEAYRTVPVNARAERYLQQILKVKDLPRRNRLPLILTVRGMQDRYRLIYARALAAANSQKSVPREEVWLLTNNFSTGGAQSSAKRLLKAWSRSATVRALTLEESVSSIGSKELEEVGIRVDHLKRVNAYERFLELMRRVASYGPPKALFFWNTMPADKLLAVDLVPTRHFDVSPGEMYFTELSDFFSSPSIESSISNPRQYGKLLAGVVVKYGREAARMSQFLSRKPFVFPNGVHGVHPVQRAFTRPPVFGTAARIAPQKRLEDIIEAMRGVPARLLIAGKSEPGHEEYAARLRSKSPPNVRWLGERSIQSFLASIDVFVMVSEPAGCPNASLEAMHSGLPLILTDVGGANEQVIPGRNGWLVLARNVSALSEAIQQAMNIGTKKLREMAKESALLAKQFSTSRMLSSYQRLVD